MHFSSSKAVLLALAAGQSVVAHTAFTNFYVDGLDQGDGTCVRMNQEPTKVTTPIEDLSSPNMACGFSGTEGVARVCPVKSGATMTFEYRWFAEEATKGFMDPGHVGPCAIYMKKVDSAIKDPGNGDGWFKIWDEGYDESTGKWCTTKVYEAANNNNGAPGRLSAQLPQGLEGGSYLVRPELLALHNVPQNNPQFYVGCAQIFIEGGGSKKPANTVSIPGHVKLGEKSTSFNVYNKPMALPYPIPGPSVASFVDSGIKNNVLQAEGFKPEGCILEAANWCAKEVPDYSTEAGCWSSQQNCWDQNTECWDKVPPTGGAHCKLLEAKCQDLQNQCKAGKFQGPPNKGKDITPSHTMISAAAPAVTFAVSSGAAASATSAKPTSAPMSSVAAAEYSYPVEVEKQAATSGAAPTSFSLYAGASSATAAPVSQAPSAKAPASTAAPAPSAYTIDDTKEQSSVGPSKTRSHKFSLENKPSTTPAPPVVAAACDDDVVTVTEQITVTTTTIKYLTAYDDKPNHKRHHARNFGDGARHHHMV